MISHLLLYFDGACESTNPGGRCTYGWSIIDPMTRKEIAFNSGIAKEPDTPLSTNNYAEWTALLYGLLFLVEEGWQGKLDIYGDSMLVIKQVTGRWRCHKEHLRQCRDLAWYLLDKLGSNFHAQWIPRRENVYCDSLSKSPATKDIIPLPYIDTPIRAPRWKPNKLKRKQYKIQKSEKKVQNSIDRRRCLYCKKNQPKKGIPYCTPCINKIAKVL